MSSPEVRHKRCAWCGTSFAYQPKPGRPPLYCRPSHRQRQHEAKVLAQKTGLAPGHVLLTRSSYEDLRDALYRLESLAEDAIDDAQDASSLSESKKLITGLAEATNQVAGGLPRPVAES